MSASSAVVHILSAGAARQAVGEIAPLFQAAAGAEVRAQFGAVGAMAEKLLAGEDCDVLITSESMHGRLAGAGRLRSPQVSSLGLVRTAIAVRAGDPHPDVSTPDGLKSHLSAADAIYCPDVERATAGIHLASVLDRLGIRDRVAGRLRQYPNGAQAMAALAGVSGGSPIGCTQQTEIIYTDGVEVVAALPEPFALETRYVAVVTEAGAGSDAARAFVEYIVSDAARPILRRAGFN